MHERAAACGQPRDRRRHLEREFEARLGVVDLVFRVAFGVLRHREDAEDVAQEAFTKAYRSFRQLRDRERSAPGSSNDVAHGDRPARANRRRGGREVDAERRPASDRREPGSAERAERLWRAIDALPDKLRVTIVLAGIQGHNVREVAALLDMPEGTVKSRLFLARSS